MDINHEYTESCIHDSKRNKKNKAASGAARKDFPQEVALSPLSGLVE